MSIISSPEPNISPTPHRRRHCRHADAVASAVRRMVLHESQHKVRQVCEVSRRENPRLPWPTT